MSDALAELPPKTVSPLRGVLTAIVRPVAVVGVALLIGVAIILYTGEDPLSAYENLLIEPFRSWDTFSSVLFYAIPFVLTGLAAAVSFRAGTFNIGGEGQLQLGALAAAWAALSWAGLPAFLMIPAVLMVGAVAGALFAGIAGWLRAYLGATELVSTIMLNYVAIDICSYAITYGGPLATPAGNSTTPTIPASAQFATIGNSQLHWGGLVALLAVAAVFVLLYRTPLGYELRMAGANAPFALYGGVAVPRIILSAMAMSGALAGLCGAVQVMGFLHAYSTGLIKAQWGFTGVTVALLARLEPLGVIVAAFLYALLEEGTQLMETNTNVDHNIIVVVQGFIILFVTVQTVFPWLKRLRARGRIS